MPSSKTSGSANLGQLETQLNDIFGKKAPQMPQNIKDFIVKIAPYGTLIGVVFSLPLALAAIGLGAAATPFAMMGGVGSFARFSISGLFSLATLVLYALSIPGLFKRTLSAWRLLFYASLLSAVGSLLSLQLASMIVGAILSWYVLFQVRPAYK